MTARRSSTARTSRRPTGAPRGAKRPPRAERPSRAEPLRASQSEPCFDDNEDVVSWGGELIHVAGTTSGGAPYGVTVAELRRSMAAEARGAGWARAKRVLHELLEREVGRVRDVGNVKKIGDGMSREIFAAEVELAGGRCAAYVVALPRGDADRGLDERTTRELRLVARLRARRWPFRLPEMVGAFPDDDRLALVRRFAVGVELDLRAGRQPSVRPWQVVGEIAAAIHDVPDAEVEDILPGTATRRQHALAAVDAIAASADAQTPEFRDAHAWALAHLPPDEPSTLLHGDLLGQNILLAVDGPPHVLDWEHARRGDPAHDLAVVTRGVRQPFQIAGGLERLLDDYRAHGGCAVTTSHVRIHELALIAGWVRAARSGSSAGSPDDALVPMRGLLRQLR